MKMTVRYHIVFIKIATIKKQKITSVETMWKNLSTCTLLVGMQNYIATVGKQCGTSSKVKKQNYHMIQQFHFWVYTQKN